MRRREQLDPVAARELAAIDAALAGNPRGAIAPEDAELAELATLLVAEAPRPSTSFAASLDARVARRFPAPAKPQQARRARRIPLVPAFAGVALAAVLALLVAFNSLDRGSDQEMSASSSSGASAPALDSSASEAPAAAPESAAPDADAAAGTAAPDRAAAPSPAIGRKVEQSSTVELGAPAEKVDDVAQGVLGVVDRNGGIVDESTVATRTGGGEASFELRIPAARLQAALGQLSRLPDAEVLSRTDDTLDVNQAYVSVRRKLDAAEAERTGLLRALENASDDAERDRLKVRIGEVEQQVATLARSQRALDRRVDYSRVDLTVRAVADDGSGGGTSFTPGSALHDAGRVLAVTAGVIVIAAAALVPVVLLALLAWPLARAARRRRREHALDGA
jgi:hypothetical protein